MTKTLTLAAILAPGLALAHPGHVTAEAGHHHLETGALVVLGILAAAWIARRLLGTGQPR
ncbi:MAG: DUF6732 family protein [Pseudomonadota bacterium]